MTDDAALVLTDINMSYATSDDIINTEKLEEKANIPVVHFTQISLIPKVLKYWKDTLLA